MPSIRDIDISELRAMWRKRAAAVEEVRRRADPTGMTRPARDPAEAAFLRETGQEGPFTEVERPGWREWVTRRDKPARFYAPPSEVRDDVGGEDAGRGSVSSIPGDQPAQPGPPAPIIPQPASPDP